ncbi:unnamed protein product [Prorocentrum cordatum]|uniref:Thioredoxin domain-containing protein n=1 Tax=Prorocentrum cordatum TaxID=2364126 RepID=A0ABN9WBZ2_9DINO|nr:unnamed protein product [Polarella glacialis]
MQSQVTKNPEKDTLVYWYGDGCGFCQQFKKEYKQLAARLRHVKSLEITWIDASRNGVAQPKRFPTVALFPARGKEVPASRQVPFLNDQRLQAAEFMGDILKGEQTIGAMISWLHQEVRGRALGPGGRRGARLHAGHPAEPGDGHVGVPLTSRAHGHADRPVSTEPWVCAACRPCLLHAQISDDFPRRLSLATSPCCSPR